MAKKFGKVLLFAAAAGSAIAAVCYFLRKRDNEQDIAEEDDYDNFGSASEDSSDNSRSYVPLNAEAAVNQDNEEENSGESGDEASFTPLTEQVSQAMDKAEETVEEFFDEDDNSNEEPPINDN